MPDTATLKAGTRGRDKDTSSSTVHEVESSKTLRKLNVLTVKGKNLQHIKTGPKGVKID